MERFLRLEEYSKTYELFTECFGEDEEFMGEYYGTVGKDGCCTGRISSGEVAVIEEDGEPVAMVQVQYVTAIYPDGGAESVPYIMGVCTQPACRHRGYMDRLMAFVKESLTEEGYAWCFLIAVDREIYRHLGFIHDWTLSEAEQKLLYADDGLDTASACLLGSSGPDFTPPTAVTALS